jgi:hypothetical protein
MGTSRDLAAIDGKFRAAGLKPVAPYAGASEERLCHCETCGTLRRVKLRNLRSGGIACRWCHGWETWVSWSRQARVSAATWRSLGDENESMRRLHQENVAPLTPVGDLFEPVGVVCLACGETFVTVPERIRAERPGWYGCQRCSTDRKRRVRSDAGKLFTENGLHLLHPCSGEYAPQPVECMTCGAERRVSYNDLRTGSAPLCWTCTFGIRPDEPHRVYLIHFPTFGVMKVGITHNRHDRRLSDHEVEGGKVVDTVAVSDRESARRLERLLIARYRPWATDSVGPEEFPQGGWTETWRDDAPFLDLAEEANAAMATPSP